VPCLHTVQHSATHCNKTWWYKDISWQQRAPAPCLLRYLMLGPLLHPWMEVDCIHRMNLHYRLPKTFQQLLFARTGAHEYRRIGALLRKSGDNNIFGVFPKTLGQRVVVALGMLGTRELANGVVVPPIRDGCYVSGGQVQLCQRAAWRIEATKGPVCMYNFDVCIHVHMCVYVCICVHTWRCGGEATQRMCVCVGMYSCMFVCMFVCMYNFYVFLHVCMFVCMYDCMYVCTTFMFVCMFACSYVCMFVYMYVCMYVCLYVCLYVCMYISMYIYVDVYICI